MQAVRTGLSERVKDAEKALNSCVIFFTSQLIVIKTYYLCFNNNKNNSYFIYIYVYNYCTIVSVKNTV